jgi:hypothetical protein
MDTSKTSTALEVISRHNVADVCIDTITAHHSLHAAIDFKAGQSILRFSAMTTQESATYLTIQIGLNTHITLFPEFLQYVNHSCDPNIFFDTTLMELIALKAIQPGDELCFFYPSTEWEMAQPFLCRCGNTDCLQFIEGAANMSPEILNKYRLTDFISKQLKLKK